MHRTITILLCLALVPSSGFSSDVGQKSEPVSPSSSAQYPKRIETKVTPSPLPLFLTVPTEFADVTKFVFEDSARPDSWMYCDPDDAQLMHDLLRAKRAHEQPNKGCLQVSLDTSSSFDITTRKFSVEQFIEEGIAYKKKWPNRRSSSPRFDLEFHSYTKQEVRGVPTVTYIQDAVHETGNTRARFLYVADGAKVWVVMLFSGKNEDISSALWNAFIGGL